MKGPSITDDASALPLVVFSVNLDLKGVERPNQPRSINVSIKIID